MTFRQKQIIKNLKKIFEKNAKAMSHIQYLNLCKENEVIPKGLNLANLIKSEELWKGNESKILEALNGTSKNIVEDQIDRWVVTKSELDQKIHELRKVAKNVFNQEAYEEEMKRLLKHASNVLNEENLRKRKKYDSAKVNMKAWEAKATVIPHKKKNRRFVRKHKSCGIGPGT